MEREYYYYDDDYGDEEGEAWEAALENAYASAKSMMDTKPEECAAGMRGVERDDPVGGKWTFKAIKMLARVGRRTKAYEDMLRYYTRMANFSHPDVSKGAVQKAMTKFIEEAQQVPVDYLRRALLTTIEVTARDRNVFGKLWFNAKLKHATLSLEANAPDAVLEEMEPVLAWCKEEDQFSLKKSAQLFLSYALLLEAYTKKRDYSQMRDTFLLATSIVNTIPPSRVAGGVLECGGKMYMHLRDWPAAFRAFSVAFRNYNEIGDPRRIGCLKCLVLTCMLGGSSIDPFATHETKVYESAAEMEPVAKLMKTFTGNDVRGFLDVVAMHQEMLDADPTVHDCLDLVLEQLRLRALVAYTVPYQRIYLKRLEDVLLVNGNEVERLCVRAVTEGALHAFIDDGEGILIMQNEQAVVPEAERLQALNRCSTALLDSNEATRREVEHLP
ncbi:putative proteasome regulatory non-ATPase subunit 6 [Trypanosoma grayi]|uniref:putative proteasome regulatory non-ATPase subunit 6 n=1 Tax=Trypanosoma grayi TaxID=71804 RepID=UPI0004F4B4CC|nr:putative proteasome regulatory non-ATPase subunit 6 [Trypanosoma grayi]KEG13196.1 putative proteasome regulatory non-ATPase subunit 6 [Trypanosoma grayi]